MNQKRRWESVTTSHTTERLGSVNAHKDSSAKASTTGGWRLTIEGGPRNACVVLCVVVAGLVISTLRSRCDKSDGNQHKQSSEIVGDAESQRGTNMGLIACQIRREQIHTGLSLQNWFGKGRM